MNANVWSLAFFCWGIVVAEGQLLQASAIMDSGVIKVVTGIQSDALATASFNVSYTSIGWNTLVIETSTNVSYSDSDKRYAAGLVEGFLTYEYIYDLYQNIYTSFMDINVTATAIIMDFVHDNDQWIRQQAQQNSVSGSYWNQVSLIYAQFDGMVAGAKLAAPANMDISKDMLLLLNYDGDMIDIVAGILFDATFELPRGLRSHCSALIRLTEDDLFAAHTTWSDFTTMVRIFKRYSFHSTDVAADEVLFSSYPGSLSSVDDFYVLNSGLYVTETTIMNFNLFLYEELTPESVPTWIRVQVANALANNSKEWCVIFSQENSGTYNNQWMVLDYNQYQKGASQLSPNTLWILEQMPGKTQSADVTDVVNAQGYWGSYNVPYFEYFYEMMGYPLAGLVDSEVTHNCSRAKIFHRDSPKVSNLQDMQKFMQYNEWQTDPASEGDACKSISARCDLSSNWIQGGASGGIDSKITSSEWMKSMNALAICGPTHETQAPFSWTPEWLNNTVVLGQPTTWDFDWVFMDF